MKYLLLLMLICTGAMAQSKTLSFKLNDLRIQSLDLGRFELILKNKQKIKSQYVSDKYAEKYGFELNFIFIKALMAEFQQRKDLFPNGMIQINLDKYGEIVLSDKTLRLISTGESPKENQEALLEKQIELLEAEVQRLREKSISQSTFSYVEDKLKSCESENVNLKIMLAGLQTNTMDQEYGKLETTDNLNKIVQSQSSNALEN